MLDPIDQNTHRFLWRDMKLRDEPSTYVVSRISFGDRPARIIANLALRKTAEFGMEKYPRAYNTIVRNAYVDDIIDSIEDISSARKVTTVIENLLLKGNFKVKEWSFTGLGGTVYQKIVDSEEIFTENDVIGKGSSTQRVLGMNWDYKQDSFYFTVKLNFSAKRKNVRTGRNITREEYPVGVPEILTKRIILQQVNGFYDVFGFATPFILKSKVLIRNLWVGENKTLGWDEAIPENARKKWILFF